MHYCPISLDDVKRITDSTTLQRISEFLFTVSTRITASILKQCTEKVDLDSEGEGTTSCVKQSTNYYPKAHSPAINWGKYNESGAISTQVSQEHESETLWGIYLHTVSIRHCIP